MGLGEHTLKMLNEGVMKFNENEERHFVNFKISIDENDIEMNNAYFIHFNGVSNRINKTRNLIFKRGWI